MSSQLQYLGSNISHLRQIHQHRRSKLAAITGLSSATLSKLEQNKCTKVDYHTLETIVVYFGLTVHELVNTDLGKDDPVNLELRQLEYNFSYFSESDNRAILTITANEIGQLTANSMFHHRARKRPQH